MAAQLRFRARIATVLLTLLAVCCLGGCERRDPASTARSGTQLRVTATILPLADWAAQIGGDLVTTAALLPAGANPHTFEATPADMRQLGESDLILKVGLGLDDWADPLARASGPGARVLALGDLLQSHGDLPTVSDLALETDEHAHEHPGGRNPHFWLDPVLAQKAVMVLRDEMTGREPRNGDAYAARAESYLKELSKLDAELSATLAPCKQRSIVTVHNSFPYLASRYGLTIAAVIEEFPGRTPSDQYTRRIVDLLRRENIRTIFAEPQLSRRHAEIIAQEAGAGVDLLDPLGDIGVAERSTYLGIMSFNERQLQKALCEQKAQASRKN